MASQKKKTSPNLSVAAGITVLAAVPAAREISYLRDTAPLQTQVQQLDAKIKSDDDSFKNIKTTELQQVLNFQPTSDAEKWVLRNPSPALQQDVRQLLDETNSLAGNGHPSTSPSTQESLNPSQRDFLVREFSSIGHNESNGSGTQQHTDLETDPQVKAIINDVAEAESKKVEAKNQLETMKNSHDHDMNWIAAAEGTSIAGTAIIGTATSRLLRRRSRSQTASKG